DVEDSRRGPHGAQLRLADEVHGGGQQGRVDGQEVDGGQQVVERGHQLDTGLAGHVCAGVGVDGADLHAQALGHAGDVEADLAEADDTERLAADFDANELAALPAAGLDAAVGPAHVAGGGEQQCNG